MGYQLADHYDRYSDGSHDETYDRHLFLAGRTLQSAEANEIQTRAADRLRGMMDTLFRDGAVLSGSEIVVDSGSGATQVANGAVYLRGAARGVPPATFTVPTTGTVRVGVYMREQVVTELEDPSLRDPAVSLLNYQDPGAARLQVVCAWGREGDGQDGDFYGVWVVENGVVISNTPPPDIDAVSQAIARYDRQSSGGMYVSNGFSVRRVSDGPGGEQVYSVEAGVARVNGTEIVRDHARRLVYAATPDTRLVALEPKLAVGGSERVQTNFSPIDVIESVSITREIEETKTHGAFSGASDLLGNSPVVEIVRVSDTPGGGADYVAGVDYQLTADAVDWSLAGAEPAPGGTYYVTYRYVATVAPVAPDATGFTVEDAVPGTLIQTTYRWAMPRFDLICIGDDGELRVITGVSHPVRPRYPSSPAGLLGLAVIRQAWSDATRVVNNATRMVSMGELNSVNGRIDTLFALVAEERLALNLTNRDPTAKRGVFADPFFDDDLRDQGIAQTAAIVRGELRLGLDASAQSVSLDEPATLNASVRVEDVVELGPEQVVIDQPLRTGDMLVNPYDSFSPIPAIAVLSPAVDFWMEFATNWVSPIERQLDEDVWVNPEQRDYWIDRYRNDPLFRRNMDRIFGGFEQFVEGHTLVVSEDIQYRTEVERVGSRFVELQYLRQIPVAFTLFGLGAGEVLDSVVFDGLPVVPREAP